MSKRLLEKENFKCIKHALKENYKRVTELSKANETKNSPTNGEEVKPQTQDQSNSTPQKVSKSLSKAISLFSKVRLFRSLQIVHIKQEGIKFHNPEDFFPNQFHQQIINSKLDSEAPKPPQTSGTTNSITTELPHNE
jgi:hypothetical protein